MSAIPLPGQDVPEPQAPAAAEASPVSRPGALRGRVWLSLQTRQAERLVRGRRGAPARAPIIGLVGFACQLRSLWHGARAADPYADAWLLRVETALERAFAVVEAEAGALQAALAAASALELAPVTCERPTRVALQFSNPYAYQGAELLGRFDAYAAAVLGARHVGLLAPEEAERRLALGARPVRGAYASALGYRVLGLTREDLHQGTARAAQARELMGELPAAVLAGQARARLAPARAVPPATGIEPSLGPLAGEG